MKKKILLVSILSLVFLTHGFGQGSIKFQIGYGIPLTNSTTAQSVQVNSASSTTYTSVYGSYGSGLRLEAGYIHPLNKRFYLEMDLSYLIGKPYNSTYSSYNSGSIQKSSNYSRFYEFSPLLRANLGENAIRPYAAVGPIFGLGTIISNTKVNTSEFQREYSGSVAIGAKSAIGVEFTQRSFTFYAQVTLIAMSYAPEKSEYTKYIQNGVNQLPSMPTSQKQFVYKETITNNGTPDPTKPTEELKFFVPYSNISLNVGVMFKL